MKELKEDRARHLITRFKEWNPVKELKVLIHHAMGCDNTESWNPVKELKDTKFSSSATRANASWNPVKELKVMFLVDKDFLTVLVVESGEGIERTVGRFNEDSIPAKVESGEGIESQTFSIIEPR